MLGKVILSGEIKKVNITKNITDTITYGKSNKKNDSNGILDTVYMTILCGAPIGRTIQPTFAAMVCKETVNIVKSILSTFLKPIWRMVQILLRKHR